MARETKTVEAVSPIAALNAAFPHWHVEAVAEIPSDGYTIYSANVGDVTLMAWKNSVHPDGTALYICKAVCW